MNLRERIIHEALGLFSLKGYLSTTIDDILAATNASKGGFYNHFKSKDELFETVLAEARRIWRAKVLAGLEGQGSHLDKLRLFLANYRDNYLKDWENIPGGCVFVTLSVELDDQRPDFAQEIQKGFLGVKRILKELLARAEASGEISPGVDIEAVSDMLFSGMIGASVIFGMDKSNPTLDRSMGSLLAFLDTIAA